MRYKSKKTLLRTIRSTKHALLLDTITISIVNQRFTY